MRHLLRTAGRQTLRRGLPLLAVLGLTAAVGGADADVVTVGADPAKHLVLDPRVIDTAEGTRLVPGTIEKDDRNPLFQADKPWENSLNNLYPNAVYDDDQNVFKLWYKCVLSDKDVIARMMPPATVHDQGWFLLYATSADGLTWEKPALGLHGFDGSEDNNAVARDVPNVGVFKDPRHDADPARRYMMVYDVGLGKVRVRFSVDGVRWSDPVVPEGLGESGDTHNNAFWDARLGRYVLITRQVEDGGRLVYRSGSEDFLKWSAPTLALRSSPEEGKARRTYCMPAFAYAGGYVGFVMMYNAGSDRTVDCELTWSPDSVTWTRVFPNKPFIPRGPAGSYDAGCVYAQANPPVLKDGRLWIYYGGSTAVHRGCAGAGHRQPLR